MKKKKKKPKPGYLNLIMFITGLILLTTSAAFPALTDSSDLIRGFMTGVSMMLFGTVLLKLASRKRINGDNRR